jgi:ribosomal-protein-alanine N-acetyltransferase
VTRRIAAVPCGAARPLARLHRACFPGEPWGAEAIRQIMGMPGFFGRVGWMNDMPVGFALALSVGAEAEILSLGVLPDRRHCGFGSAILDAVCGEAQLRGAENVFLEVALDNKAAVALYARRGFIVVGSRPNYYRRAQGFGDALIMRAPLATAETAI